MRNNIAVIITSYNRKQKTMAAIAAVRLQSLPSGSGCTVFLLDDNSSDGTAEAVEKSFPEVRLLHGSGSEYWNGGMRLAYAEAMKENFDFYVFLNDDVDLQSDAIRRLLETYEALRLDGESRSIVVGSLQDPRTGETTYGGVSRVSRLRPLAFRRVPPGRERLKCDTFNANLVLVPCEVTERLGNLSEAFQHAMGDFDYGLRAWKNGCSVWVAPGHFGVCSRNPANESDNGDLPFGKRWKAFCSLKGLPPKSWSKLARRHAGYFWPIYFASPYIQFAIRCFWRRRDVTSIA